MHIAMHAFAKIPYFLQPCILVASHKRYVSDSCLGGVMHYFYRCLRIGTISLLLAFLWRMWSNGILISGGSA